MTFLPKDYKVPTAQSGYMKFKPGANTFRILDKAIVGWEYWNEDNKPVRSKERFNGVPADIRLEDDGQPSRIKHFWAFPVWNYDDQAIQILQIVQATVQGAMSIKISNRGGDAEGYDFIVTRTGEGLLTDYDVDVKEPSPVNPKIAEMYKLSNININALFNGENPFEANETEEEVNVEDIPSGYLISPL